MLCIDTATYINDDMKTCSQNSDVWDLISSLLPLLK